MPLWKEYYVAKSIPEALEAISASPDLTRFIAGGTDLLLDLQQGRHPPVELLVDVNSIPELKVVEIRQGRLFIGAAVPLSDLLSSALVARHAQALGEACGLIGGPQVRNVATLGGNIAHALPAADGTIALLACDAVVEIAGTSGFRHSPVEQLFAGPGRSTLDVSEELITGFSLPLQQSFQASAFKRVMRPQGVALPILNMAAWIERDGERIKDVRIAVGPAGPIPFRARLTEKTLRGQVFEDRTIDAAIGILHSETSFRTSPHRATMDYRRYLAETLLFDSLRTAWSRTAHSHY